MSNIFELNDEQLIEQFIEGNDRLLMSAGLRLEVTASVAQLLSRNGEQIAIVKRQHQPKTIIVRKTSNFAHLIDRLAGAKNFVNLGDASRDCFTEYKQYPTPAGYRMWHTDPAILWKRWWPTEKFQNKQRFNMDILVNVKDNWYPVQNIIVSAGTFTIKTLADQLILNRSSKILWLDQIGHETNSVTEDSISTLKTVDLGRVTHSKNSSLATDLVSKIQQKKSELQSDRAWEMFKDLEQKLQEQIKLNTELADKCDRSEQRAMVAEQRLQMIYRYFQQNGINPRDIYTNKTPINS